MKYSVKGTPHKRRVEFACAACTAPLESPLEDAGQTFACPTCGRDVVTPGVAELEQQRREEEAEKARRGSEQREKTLKAAQDQRRREEQAATQRQAKDAQRAQREQARAAARAKRRHVSAAEFAATMLLLVLAMYFAFIRPLATKLAATQAALDEAKRNVETIRRTTEAALETLRETVNQNADVANRNTEVVRRATAALTADLAETDRIARNANQHAHSHSRF